MLSCHHKYSRGIIPVRRPPDGYVGNEDWSNIMETKKRFRLTCISTVVLLIVGCLITFRLLEIRAVQTAIPADNRQILDHSQQFYLYSLDPHPLEVKADEDFHDTRILTRTLVTNPRARASLLTAFYNGIEEGNGDQMGCFDPQIGIRAVRNGQTVDLVICYACLHVEIYDRHGFRSASTSNSPLPVFIRILSEAGVTLDRQ